MHTTIGSFSLVGRWRGLQNRMYLRLKSNPARVRKMGERLWQAKSRHRQRGSQTVFSSFMFFSFVCFLNNTLSPRKLFARRGTSGRGCLRDAQLWDCGVLTPATIVRGGDFAGRRGPWLPRSPTCGQCNVLTSAASTILRSCVNSVAPNIRAVATMIRSAGSR